jgi:hypothetical protein
MGTVAVTAPARPDWYQHVHDSEHPAWCERGHRCALGEHRAQPVRLDRPGTGSVVLTRVAGRGREFAEVTMSVRLAPGEFNAKAHLLHVLAALEDLLEQVDITSI